MALTRKMLKAMNIEEEKIEQIIDAHSETVDALKSERDSYKEAAEKLPAVQAELEKLTKNGGDWQAKFEKEHADFEAYKSEIEAGHTRQAKENAYMKLLRDAGIGQEWAEDIARIADYDAMEIDGETLKDAADITANVKQKYSRYVDKPVVTGAPTANPPANTGNGGTMSKNEIMKIKDPVARQTAIAENITLFQ